MEVYPNPFVNYLNIEFFAEQDGEADISIYDMAGRRILHQVVQAHAGKNKYEWNSSTAPAISCAGGVHVVRVTVDGETFVQEVIKK